MTARVTNWFNQLKRSLRKLNIFSQKPSVPIVPKDHLTKTLGKFEPYLFQIQSVLIWENPLISALTILAANFIFWFLVSFEFRFYGILFTLALFCVLYEMWMEKIWPEISIPSVDLKEEEEAWIPPQLSSGILSVPEISSYIMETVKLIKSYLHYLKTLREEQPGVFCCEMCAVFGALMLIGRAVSGAVIGYCLLMLLLIGPGVCIHVLPPTAIKKLLEFLSILRVKGRESDSEGEDMLPESTNENLALFYMANESDHSDKEDTFEFGLDPMTSLTGLTPSQAHGENNSLDSLDSLELSQQVSQQQQQQPCELLTDSDDEVDPGIHFQSSHFNGDSSSEEESAFSKGLSFVDSPSTQQVATTLPGPTLMSGLTQNLANLGTSLISSVLANRTSNEPVRRRSSSGSEEFEIISKEELS